MGVLGFEPVVQHPCVHERRRSACGCAAGTVRGLAIHLPAPPRSGARAVADQPAAGPDIWRSRRRRPTKDRLLVISMRSSNLGGRLAISSGAVPFSMAAACPALDKSGRARDRPARGVDRVCLVR